jgi:Mg-chelatase subunit ChlD
MPDPQAQPELAEAVAFLAQAQRHLLLGHDRDAVGSLRDVLEQTKLAFDDDDVIAPDLHRVLFDNSRSMNKAERLRVLRRALMLVTHPARHRDQVSVAIDWSRIDAAQLIMMTAAFLNEMSAPDARPAQRGSTASDG